MKSQAQIEKNYKDAASVAASRYRDSISGVEWQSKAIQGQDLYVQQMQNAEILARREKGIGKVSDAAFKQAMLEKGAPVIGTRMGQAAGKMAQNYAPYRAALEGLTLPERSADPMANIDNRLKPVVQALVETKKRT